MSDLNSPKDHWRRGFFVLLVVSLSLGSVGLGAVGSWWLYDQQVAAPTALEPGVDGNTLTTDEEVSIASVVEKVSPGVVSIITSSEVRSFYGTISQTGAGTGIIVSENGYIITNNHVIEGASTVRVVDNKGKVYEDVKVIGRDPLNDIAFLKVNSGLTFSPIEIGDSSTVRIGQQVVAIGNALGQYNNTVTSGIISGTNRPVTASGSDGQTESLTDLLQTDASINPGNSGGPLLNMAGQVIGINTAVADDANGIGFAIPIDSTKGVLAEVLESGTIRRAYIGINYLDITPQIAQQYELPVSIGSYIYAQNSAAIIKGGPADKAGLQQEDIIQKVNDLTVGEDGGLSSIIGRFRVGDTVTLTVLRDNTTITRDVTFGEYSP
ncbi:trypsin-like serine protease [Candidatus Saccharibacteria bacterium]|nr:trypsin-like serine protease [Candidatus Saccharibacteria bacterium]NCS82913.1 trypsin-like serine protease [Candidatus Saccharibacteria bacterium]